MLAPTITITIVQLDSCAPAGHLPDWLDGVTSRTVRAWDGEPLPQPESVGEGLVVLGGPMGVHDTAAAPWLTATRELLAAAVARQVPVLAIGLGFQLLVMATGGQVAVAAPPGHEAGMVSIKARPAAHHDPVLSALFDSEATIHQPSMHRDAVVELPQEATWLAQSRMYPYQAARIGSALGVQFHPESDDAQLERWADRDDVVAETLRGPAAPTEEARAAGARLVQAFAAEVHAAARVSA